jgi:hypothetical protein
MCVHLVPTDARSHENPLSNTKCRCDRISNPVRLHKSFKGRLHGAFFMCVSMYEKPFDAEACDISGQAYMKNGLSGIETHIKNALCNRPLRRLKFKIPKSGGPIWYRGIF